VLNDEGAPIITVGGAENGGITFRNKDGKVTVRIGGGNGSMSIYNKDRKRGAAISANADGGALRIANKEGKTVVVISADADGNGAIKIFDSKGELTSQSP
jgi:hypothetical protein